MVMLIIVPSGFPQEPIPPPIHNNVAWATSETSGTIRMHLVAVGPTFRVVTGRGPTDLVGLDRSFSYLLLFRPHNSIYRYEAHGQRISEWAGTAIGHVRVYRQFASWAPPKGPPGCGYLKMHLSD